MSVYEDEDTHTKTCVALRRARIVKVCICPKGGR